MNSKALFLKTRELTAYWVPIAHDPKFELVLTYARAEFCERQPTQAELAGAEKIIQILQTLAEEAQQFEDFPSPGLIHQIDKLPDKPKES